MYKYFIIIILCVSCSQGESNIQSISIYNLRSVCSKGGEPNLYVSVMGQAYLSWIEYQDSTHRALQFSTLENGDWSEPRQIASGDNWFVNWADFPSLVSFNHDQSLAAHWLQKSAEGTYDYDIHIAQSNDKGKHWSPSIIPHNDGIAAEHGFVSMVAGLGDSTAHISWLDGRYTQSTHETSSDQKVSDHTHLHEGAGAMTIRCARIDATGQLSQEVELDDRVCDCCQTSVAMTSNGPVVAYRNRSDQEVRDIYLARQVDGEWLEPQPVHNDGWKIAGCPVNGPVVRAQGEAVMVVWFSHADDIPKVLAAFSGDGGKNFEPPIQVDRGNPLGRVDGVMLSNTSGLVSWLEQSDEESHIYLAHVSSENQEVNVKTITQTSEARSSGFPQLEMTPDQIILAWTHVDSLTSIRSIAMNRAQFE